MKRKLQQLGGLALLVCAILLAFARKPGPSGHGSQDLNAAAGAGDRSARQAIPRDQARNGGDRMVGRIVYRDELRRVLDLALDSEDDNSLADFVNQHAGGDFLAVLDEVRSDAEFITRRLQMEEALVRSWSTSDPDAALHWARNLPEWERAETFDRVCRNAASKVPAKAMRALLGMNDESARAGDADNIADSWATQDLAGLVRWARELPDGDLRGRMFAKASERQAMDDPRGAIALSLAEVPAGDLQESVAISIVREWGMQDPEGAEEWVEQFPPSDLRDRAWCELGATQQASFGPARTSLDE